MTRELNIIIHTCIVIGMILGILNIDGSLLYRMLMNTIIIVVGMASALTIIGMMGKGDNHSPKSNENKNEDESDKDYITREWPNE